MDTERAIESAETLLRQWAILVDDIAPWRLDVLIPASELRSAARMLCGTEWGDLTSITVLELGDEGREYELIYDFRRGPALVCLRVQLATLSDSIPSLTEICDCAQPFEASFTERYGIVFD